MHTQRGKEDTNERLPNLESQPTAQVLRPERRALRDFMLPTRTRYHNISLVSTLSQIPQSINTAVPQKIGCTALWNRMSTNQRLRRVASQRSIEPKITALFAFSSYVENSMQALKLTKNFVEFSELQRRWAQLFGLLAEENYRITRNYSMTSAALSYICEVAGIEILPPNLNSVPGLDRAAKMAYDEGIPVASVLRHEILILLLEAATPDHRRRILDQHSSEILEDCERVLSGVTNGWADESREVIYTLRDQHERSAQSHATGIITNIVDFIIDKIKNYDPDCRKPSDLAKRLSRYKSLPDVELVKILAFLPLGPALASWDRNGNAPIPDRYSRHATVHAVGQPGIFSRTNALTAAMLAISLTRQLWNDPDVSSILRLITGSASQN